ncbi:hypothetical protein AGMMS49983_13990 [Clostridia bacterium]|nr:hypothetical protein AGMMS49983_13990 [Clostridia bacterium]
MNKYSQIRYWVDNLPKLGTMSFSIEDAVAEFPEKDYAQIKNAINRLSKSGKIQSVWKGYYAIVRPEYGLKGIVPPTEYIDGLMTHLEQKYYVALLSAADLLGAAHQKPQVFTFISDYFMHPKLNENVRLVPVYKKRITEKYLTKMNVWSGSIFVSSPELTMIDLLMYHQKSGGLNHVVTVLSELTEAVDFGKVDNDFFVGLPASALQRLGFLLDDVLEDSVQADLLLDKIQRAGIKFRKCLLATSNTQDNAKDYPINSKWKIIVNYEVEADI